MTKNPLASPGIFGVNAGAGFSSSALCFSFISDRFRRLRGFRLPERRLLLQPFILSAHLEGKA
ncbi:hypothetical protein QKW52_13925 [Bacillus sonorensis]|nr:hypothetical protein [Bacillus sonorensis]